MSRQTPFRAIPKAFVIGFDFFGDFTHQLLEPVVVSETGHEHQAGVATRVEKLAECDQPIPKPVLAIRIAGRVNLTVIANVSDVLRIREHDAPELYGIHCCYVIVADSGERATMNGVSGPRQFVRCLRGFQTGSTAYARFAMVVPEGLRT